MSWDRVHVPTRRTMFLYKVVLIKISKGLAAIGVSGESPARGAGSPASMSSDSNVAVHHGLNEL